MERINPNNLEIRDFTKSTKDWTVSNRMAKNFKREAVGVDTVEVTPSKNKKFVTCPKCRKELRGNNPNRIPTHDEKRWNSTGICSGSWVKKSSGVTEVKNLTSTSTMIGKIAIGDKVIIDFTRDILKEYLPINDLFETTVEKIEVTNYFNNGGEIYASNELIFFVGVEKGINTFSLKKFFCLA
jgi:hypothetical protein